MKIRIVPLLKRIYFVLVITTANWLVGLPFMLKSTILFQLEHLKSRSGRSADFAYQLRIHCLTKIPNNWFELFDRLGLHSINMLHTVSPEKKSGGVDCWETIQAVGQSKWTHCIYFYIYIQGVPQKSIFKETHGNRVKLALKAYSTRNSKMFSHWALLETISFYRCKWQMNFISE